MVTALSVVEGKLMGAIDTPRAERAVRELLTSLGYQVEGSDALCDTPARVVRAWAEMLAGERQSGLEVLARRFQTPGFDEVVALRDISFYSVCEHHLLPFHGQASVAYIPAAGGDVVGLSKLARLVEIHARRLQLQERMTQAIAEDIVTALRPKGVAVLVRAQHMCMCSRGVKKPGAEMVTSYMQGCFREKAEARAEVMSILRGER